MTPPAPSRICIVAPEFIGPFPNGGVGTACYWEAVTLAAAGHEVTVLYTGPTDRRTPAHWESHYAGTFRYVDLWRWTAASSPHLQEDGGGDACVEARTGDLVLRYLRQHAFDLLLFQEFMGHGARTLQARRSGDALAETPAVVTVHSCRQWIYEGMRRTPSSRADLYVDFLERESARLSDQVIAPSAHMAQWVTDRWRLGQPPTVVPYCYDASVERAAERVEHCGPFTQLVFFGRLETRKGLHLFCRALARDAKTRGPVRRAVFLGKLATVEGGGSEEFIRRTLSGVPGLEIEVLDSLDSMQAWAWLERQRNTLVVTPSVVDNLPYAMLELFTRRMPFVATNIGGIPEIVGTSNAHLLADPTVDALAATLGHVHQEGSLAIDYRAGYSAADANRDHLAFVDGMLRAPKRHVVEQGPTSFDVVVVDADEHALKALSRRLSAADPSTAAATFMTWPQWRRQTAKRAALFASSTVLPRPGAVRRLLHGLQTSPVDAVTSYYAIDTSDGTPIAPLGPSLEAGWVENVFGGPCFAVTAAACDHIRTSSSHAFSFWAAYASLVCSGRDLALVPEVLYSSACADVLSASTAVEDVARMYQRDARQRIDLGWLLKCARGGADTRDRTSEDIGVGRALYDHLLAIPERHLMAYVDADSGAGQEPLVAETRRLKTRLSALTQRWRQTGPRVFMYGAGEHARLALTLEPELGQFLAGFLDRRPLASFLGKPCLRPHQLTAFDADAVLYSSREHERDMHAQLAHLPVEHALLYAPSPAPAVETTSVRLRRRLGHESAPVETRRQLPGPPSWVQGGISGDDADFLVELVSGTRPETVVEIGVAAGTSSAALLFALDQLPAPDRRLLYSCDVRGTCYFDAGRLVGESVRSMYPDFSARWVLNTDSSALRIGSSLARESVDFSFIDANHCHPWPLIDLLHLVPALRRESWVALHDIDLPARHPQFAAHGAQWLYEAWPFNKVRGFGDQSSIGAIQLPADAGQLVPFALALLTRTWEHVPEQHHVSLPPMFAALTAVLEGRLARAETAVA